MSRKPAPAEVPSFTSDRMRFYGPLITPRVIELARHRVYTREKFFKGTKPTVDDDKQVLRMALIVAYEMHPLTDWHDEEEALIRGIDSDTLRIRKKQPGFRPI